MNKERGVTVLIASDLASSLGGLLHVGEAAKTPER
jgi:hypothetical protein